MKINLLPREYRPSGKIQKITKTLKRTSVVVLGFYIFALIALFGGLFFLTNSRAAIEGENQQLADRIEALRTHEGLLLSLKDRTGLAKEVFSQASVPEELIDDMVEILPAEVEFTEISADEFSLILNARAPDSLTLARSIAALEKKEFSRVSLKGLNQSNAGGYMFSLEVK